MPEIRGEEKERLGTPICRDDEDVASRQGSISKSRCLGFSMQMVFRREGSGGASGMGKNYLRGARLCRASGLRAVGPLRGLFGASFFLVQPLSYKRKDSFAQRRLPRYGARFSLRCIQEQHHC